ncbi:hypothetical protein ACFLX2_00385 [Candidatus Dependentiae bacterium]
MNWKQPFFLLICLPMMATDDVAVSQDMHPNFNMPTNVTVENNPTLTLNIVADLRNEIHALFQQLQITQTIVRWKQAVTDRFDHVKNRTLGFCEQSKELIVDHKYKILGVGIIGVCVFFIYQILRGNSYLARDNLWSAWKNNLEMEELLAMPKQELANKLMIEVQKRYVNTEDPADFLSPMVDFMKDVENELSELRYYRRLYSWNSKIYLSKILPFNKKLFDGIKEKIQRLLYFKNGFASWVAQYKMLNALKKSRMIRRSRRIHAAS